MHLKIETLLRTVSDYQKFCNPDNPSVIPFSSHQAELSESDLDLIAAAAKHPAPFPYGTSSKKHTP